MAYAQTSPFSLDTESPANIENQGDAAGAQQLAWLTAQSKASANSPKRHLLVLRFALVNIIAAGLLGAAYHQGLVERAFAADKTYLSVAICFVFLAGLIVCARRVWETSRDLEQVDHFDPLRDSHATLYIASLRGRAGDSRSLLASSLRMKLTHRIAVVRNVANSLVLLGLIGTVVGFIIALSGVDPEQASDVSAITPMVSTLIEGMSTALYTTLVGAILNVWLMINYQLLAAGTVRLITALVEFGESHGRA
ncbi:MotA/TolQ/ExbB proton channel family protein [Pelagibius sp. Alg239-R121]|uniref:MotA/TolQ/ExbB proton channel family protein n=1 Tax=Pelagibius sp. Alg239-R121 TaxID=2993448 RepID=UPI0024A6723B|nr:MotA/TolQ/ExbB proton channel family protein [Pelagibius sp. Alg239-R121]